MRLTRTLLIAGVVLSGCVTVNKSILSQARVGYPVPKEDVYVYFADDSIPDHERVALLDAEGSTEYTNAAEMIDELREEAGKLGANAIILNEVREPTAGERFVGALFGTGGERRGRAIAIYVSGDPAAHR